MNYTLAQIRAFCAAAGRAEARALAGVATAQRVAANADTQQFERYLQQLNRPP